MTVVHTFACENPACPVSDFPSVTGQCTTCGRGGVLVPPQVISNPARVKPPVQPPGADPVEPVRQPQASIEWTQNIEAHVEAARGPSPGNSGQGQGQGQGQANKSDKAEKDQADKTDKGRNDDRGKNR